jgi:hypothetical protein
MADLNQLLVDLEAAVKVHEDNDPVVKQKIADLTAQVTTLQSQVVTDDHEKKLVELTERVKKLSL